LLSASTASAAPPDRPNVIVILMDDFGWADLGCYGSKYHRTPNVDRLAADGMRFTDAYAACPVCSPTRASLMTGKYPARLHLTDWLPGRKDMPSQQLLRPVIEQQLPLAETTLAEMLKTAGYATGCFGKWHLGNQGFGPLEQGFDVAGGQIKPRETMSDWLTDDAIRFIDDHRAGPFFLYLPEFAVHIPLAARQELVDKYAALPQPKPGQQRNPLYAAMIESVDAAIGRLLARVKELGLERQTIVLFTSDNGGLSVVEGPNTPATSNVPLREGKGYLYEGGIRVPLIVRWPGHVEAGSTCSSPVSSIDFLPTLCELCDVPVKQPIDGQSFVPALEQREFAGHSALYWHYPHYSNQGGHPGGAIREGDWKLIEFDERGRRELYNLKNDVRENRNLAKDEPERVEQLAAKLAAWRRDVGAQRMTPNPDYVPNPQSADGRITLPARTADVHGTMLRYEPSPHKNTLGFWTRLDDWASWDFEVTKPDKFRVVALVGCGNGSGGSEVDFSIGARTLPLVVEETGGFQQFVERDLGIITLDHSGRFTLSVRPRTKPKAAVMDLRQIVLQPAP
jgi:arylsulfatase A-like enzyme